MFDLDGMTQFCLTDWDHGTQWVKVFSGRPFDQWQGLQAMVVLQMRDLRCLKWGLWQVNLQATGLVDQGRADGCGVRRTAQ